MKLIKLELEDLPLKYIPCIKQASPLRNIVTSIGCKEIYSLSAFRNGIEHMLKESIANILKDFQNEINKARNK